MTEEMILMNVLSEISQRELDNLLSGHGLETEFGEALHKFLQREDVNEVIRGKFRLETPIVSRPDTLKSIIFRLLERQNMRESELYKKCDIDKDHYYQVRDGKIKRYKHKGLFFQFALVLKLDYYETVYLLNLAGHHFTPWMSMRDYIIAHCLCNKIYDFGQVTELLEKHGAQSLYE